MTDTDKKQQNHETQRRITYTNAGGGLCEVELHMPVGNSERHLRMKRDDIKRYYADLDPSRSVIETAQGETVSVILPFKTLCKRLDGGALAGKRVIDLSDVTGKAAEEENTRKTLKQLFNTEAALSEIGENDTLVIAYGYTGKSGDRLYKLFAFLKSEVTDISTDSVGTFPRLRDWNDYKEQWGMGTKYGPYVHNLSRGNLGAILQESVRDGVKITDLRAKTRPPLKSRLTAGLKLSRQASKICGKA